MTLAQSIGKFVGPVMLLYVPSIASDPRVTLVLDLVNISQSQNGEFLPCGKTNHLKRTLILHPTNISDPGPVPWIPKGSLGSKLDPGHDSRHSDVHGQKLCDAVQEGPGHDSTH